jgi:hypothetical protein
MAHFAELDENNIVLRVIVVNNNELLDENGDESEQKGLDFCAMLFGGSWKQTSYNNSMRKQFAGVGFYFDEDTDEFVAPQPYPSWSLNETNDWIPPIPKPTGNDFCWHWHEDELAWRYD